MYFFGSRLMKRLLPPHLASRVNPRDTDLVTPSKGEYEKTKNLIGNSRNLEVYHLPVHPHRELTLDEYYTLKVSHAIYPISWNKTMSHIRGMQLAGAEIVPQFLSELRDFWSVNHNSKKYRRFDFNEALNHGDLFNDVVKRKQHHDDLHQLLVGSDTPAYHLIAPRGGIPLMDLWDKLSEEQKFEVALQEALVFTLERGGGLPFARAFNASNEALVARLHPVPIADWVIMNWNYYSTASKGHHLTVRTCELSSMPL